ncbi:LAME_0G18052g1_1 [Lachancea meyersii CBS 8951]|uniref:LAME_0G18052g1_1 n=1 Tax=Lachancea meyersii CBS 8951 TaxID=1266667 RepID=A0A1G4KBM4_9SACH|nr:LAME_0G18052g1_1 [Lachancea meyersii CBS 8951]
MGIQGLLPQLKPIQQPVTLARYEGQTLAIDGYAWLHRAAHACAEDLALGLPSTKYLEYFVKRLQMLRSRFHIHPYVVFDGDALMVKKDTEIKRRQKREENRTKALALWKSGDKRQAFEYFQKCVDVTPEMAKCIIDYCKTQEIQYVVAPFEADAQMVYLEKEGLAHGIISEDSDLVIFGCRKLITKLNDHGEAVEICRDDFSHLPAKFPLCQLDSEQIRAMVCLSGCDYTSGVPKVGLLTAIKLVKKYKTMDKIILNIQREGKFVVPKEFLDEFQWATYAFQYQRVFCPQQKIITTLNKVPSELETSEDLFNCVGKVIHCQDRVKRTVVNPADIDHVLHGKIAMGDLCPYDFEKVLVNRERKLQLTAKSMPEISTTATSGVRSIDSFFHKSALVTVSAVPDGADTKTRLFQRQQEQKLEQSERKLQSTVERRKLSRYDMPTRGTSGSKFFEQANQIAEHPRPTVAPDLPTTSRLVESTEVKVEQKSKFNHINLATRSLTSSSSNSDPDTSQEDVLTEIPSSMASTEIPSSMVPAQTDQDSTPFSEEESEILSEVDETSRPIEPSARANKRHCASLADLRENFSYQRAPLKPRDPNVNSSAGVGKAEILEKQRPVLEKQRPGLSRSKHYMSSPSSTEVQRQARRTVSLSDFIYRGQ